MSVKNNAKPLYLSVAANANNSSQNSSSKELECSHIFEDNTWEQIASVAAACRTENYCKVGDVKTIVLDDATYHVHIVG